MNRQQLLIAILMLPKSEQCCNVLGVFCLADMLYAVYTLHVRPDLDEITVGDCAIAITGDDDATISRAGEAAITGGATLKINTEFADQFTPSQRGDAWLDCLVTGERWVNRARQAQAQY